MLEILSRAYHLSTFRTTTLRLLNLVNVSRIQVCVNLLENKVINSISDPGRWLPLKQD